MKDQSPKVFARDLLQRLHELQQEFLTLVDSIVGRVEQELRSGHPPASDDIDRLQAAGRAYITLAADVGMVARTDRDRSPYSLDEMIETVGRIVATDSWTAARDEFRIDASRILQITYSGTPLPRALHKLQEDALRFLDTLNAASGDEPTSVDLNEWNARVRPFRDFWQLLVDELDETHTDEILARLQNSLGSELLKPNVFRRLKVGPEDATTATAPPSPPERPTEPPQTAQFPMSMGSVETVSKAPSANPAALCFPVPTDVAADAGSIEDDKGPPQTELTPVSLGSSEAVSNAPSADPVRSSVQTDIATDAGSAADAGTVEGNAPDQRGGSETSEIEADLLRHNTRPCAPPVARLESPSVATATDGATAERCILVWRLLGVGRTALAYHVAASIDAVSGEEPSGLRELARAAALGLAVRSSTGDVVDYLSSDVLTLQARLPNWQSSDQHSLACRLVVFGLALRPALLAPATGAVALLQGLHALDGTSDSLGAIRQAVTEFGKMSLDLSPSILKGVRDHVVWEHRLDNLRTEARAWLDSNRHASIIYEATTDVWRRWLDEGGPLGDTLRRVIEHRTEQANAVRDAVKHWAKKTAVEKELSRTDAEIRKIGARRRPIEARAQSAICARVEAFVMLAQSWLDLIAAEPHSLRDARHQKADHCRELVQRALAPALADVGALEQQADTGEVLRSAARFLRRALADIGRLFDESQEESTRPLPVRAVLGSELLAEPEIPLDTNWAPVSIAPVNLLDLLQELSADLYDPLQAFRRQMRVDNHLATARVIESLEVAPCEEMLIDQLRAERKQAIDECRRKLRRAIDETRQCVERAVCYDLVTEEERAKNLGMISDCEFMLPFDDDRDFGADLRQLKAVRDAVDAKEAQRVTEVRQKLEDTNFPADRADDRSLILQAIERRDYLSADEYLELVRTHQPLTRVSESPTFTLADFFPQFVQQFNQFMEGSGSARPEPRGLMESVRQGRTVGPIDMQGVPLPRAIEAAEMLNSWLRLKTRTGDVLPELVRLLNAFGFRGVQATSVASPESPHFLAHCQTEPLRDPTECIIPAFGSQAEGRYAVLGLFDRPAEEVIVNLAHKVGSRSRPVIVLYFGRMIEPRRRDLAEFCWQRRRSSLVIDEALVYFLATMKATRLPVLFQCALPFTVAEPYTTTASLVPIEMFFGREQERRSVMDPNGTNLVYGGRQLGKSALLRDVERREHDREAGKIVCWIDLKNRGIGISQSINDIWAEIGQTLHREQVLPHVASNAKTVAEHIKRWLDEKGERRILLLLDEADAFLEADSRAANEQTRHSFPTVSRLKGLMDDTNRRFKVVFAGLHNVQRAARDPNTPVAHLGTPVCIGPLLDRGEWRQARELIEIPFRHMGYEFDPPDLGMRILSYTNYYPSLIQIFCKHLLEYLHNKERATFDFRSSPPYKVTTRYLEEVYQSEDLQREIGHRFELTLNLDNRYRLIALCIALASIERRGERALVDGFEVTWVREQALSWWASGFAEDNSFELFRTILDEMIGLGVLRKAGPDRYALRSANVLNLLGSKKQIEEKILDVPLLPPSPRYEAATFRRTLRNDAWTRSPLTAEQEGSLIDSSNGVTLLFGSPLSGLDDLRAALDAIPTQLDVRFAEPMTQLNQFLPWLRNVDQARPDGLTLAVVDQRSTWGPNWVRHAADVIRSKTTARKRFLRVLFVADPGLAWEWTQSGLDPARNLDIKEIALQPWREAALRRWMEDSEFGAEAVNEASVVLERTGGWGLLIQSFGTRCRTAPYGWKSHLETLLQSWPTDAQWQDCRDVPQVARAVLKTMAEWDGPIGATELIELAQSVASHVPNVLRWAERLGYAQADGANGWLLNPLVRPLALSGWE